MTSVSAKFLQGEHQGRGEPSSGLQSSVVVVKNSEEDDLKTSSSSTHNSSTKQISQNPAAFTVHHQPFSQAVHSQELGSSPTTTSSNTATSYPSYNYSSSSSYPSSPFFAGKRLEGQQQQPLSRSNLVVGNSGSPNHPHPSSPSEMQQDFYRPYSLQTTTHLHHHHGSHSFGPPQPHHIIHHHPNSSSISSNRLLPQVGCGGDSLSLPVTSAPSSVAVPSFNQSASSTSPASASSTPSYNQSNSSNTSSNNASSSPNANPEAYSAGGSSFLPPETYDRLYRPHPTRPGPGMPPPTSSPVNSTANSVVVAASPSGASGRSQFARVISSPPSQSSPAAIMSNFSAASSPPQAACSPTPGATPKFRYPSGPSGASPRTTTPSSTLSSREGTPLPSNEGTPASAPNVDISRVHLEDFFHNNYSPSSSSSSSTPTRGAAAIKSEFPQNCSSAFSSLGHYNSPPGFLYGPPPPGQFPSSQQCITLSQRSQMRPKSGGLEFTGAPRGRRPGTANLGPGSSSVKIGRRPAHLPKNLKFDDKTLPPGWVRKLKQRKHGKQAGRWDVYIYSPCGVKFASRKKLKSFFEKNNLNYDPEDFDFTPYGRHLDAAARASASNSGSNAANSSSSSAHGSSGNPSGSEMVNSGRHNSSGSTGSEGTHEGSSPASLQNCSPTHSSSSHLFPPNSSFGGVNSSLGSHLPGGSSSSNEYTYPSFDPLMENPPNASALDVPPPSEIYNHRVPIQPHLKNSNERGISSPGYFPMEMAEILGDASLNGGLPPDGSGNQIHTSQQHHHLQQLHHIQANTQQQQPLNSFSDLRSRMLDPSGEEASSSDGLSPSSNKMRPLLPHAGLPGGPLPSTSDMQEKTFSIRNTISLLESGNDPYTNYSEYD